MAKAKGLGYRDAGVDIDAGNRLVDLIKPLARATARRGRRRRDRRLRRRVRPQARRTSAIRCWSPPPTASAPSSSSPSTPDRHDTIGIDLVAMCVNDLVVQGAEPLFFLDYFATGKLEPDARRGNRRGHRRGLPRGRLRADRRRDGGNAGHVCSRTTTISPASRSARSSADTLLPRTDIVPGDVILGLASSGVHSNGYSLVRKVVAESGIALDAPAPFAPEHDARRGAADADADLCALAVSPRSASRTASRRSRTSPAAASSTIFRACCPNARDALDRAARRSSPAGVQVAGARPAASRSSRCCARSIAASA